MKKCWRTIKYSGCIAGADLVKLEVCSQIYVVMDENFQSLSKHKLICSSIKSEKKITLFSFLEKVFIRYFVQTERIKHSKNWPLHLYTFPQKCFLSPPPHPPHTHTKRWIFSIYQRPNILYVPKGKFSQLEDRTLLHFPAQALRRFFLGMLSFFGFIFGSQKKFPFSQSITRMKFALL